MLLAVAMFQLVCGGTEAQMVPKQGRGGDFRRPVVALKSVRRIKKITSKESLPSGKYTFQQRARDIETSFAGDLSSLPSQLGSLLANLRAAEGTDFFR